jgi:formate dehydrogenase maturation protein FdhE
VLGLRFFACSQCDTVYAVVEDPTGCSECERGSLEEITRRMCGDAYFASSMGPK